MAERGEEISVIGTGSASIDSLMGGGFGSGELSMIYGESGTGKSTLCLQSALTAINQGESAVLVDTEGFNADRFSQITDSTPGAEELIYREVKSFQEQIEVVSALENIADLADIVFIDSLTHLYRLDQGDEGSTESMHKKLINQLGHLKSLVKRYGIAVVFSNQVYSDPEAGELRPIGGELTTAWSDCILCLQSNNGELKSVLEKQHGAERDGSTEYSITQRGLE